ncbi:MAG TPA: GNAT family N-acetyltransferase [Anaerolineae bacterium]|nr:GNAT family N-acetyltransferase [Anaerolineae bacterium]
MNPPILIRWAVPDDAYALAEIHVLAWQVAYRGLLPDSLLDSLTAADRLPRWRERLAETSSRVLVAELDGQAAGWLVIGPQRDEDLDPQRVAEIYAIYVRPDAWRHGCGAALMEWAKAELRSQGFAEATLWTLRSNQRAIRFYEAQGFWADGASKVETNRDGVAFDEVRYRCELVKRAI